MGIAFNRGRKQDREDSLSAQSLVYWDVKTNRLFVEAGNYEIMIGSTSEDIRERQIIKTVPAIQK